MVGGLTGPLGEGPSEGPVKGVLFEDHVKQRGQGTGAWENARKKIRQLDDNGNETEDDTEDDVGDETKDDTGDDVRDDTGKAAWTHAGKDAQRIARLSRGMSHELSLTMTGS